MKKIIKKFHSDSHHGWLCVKMREIEELGLTTQVTSYSYLKKQSVYLEEDVDMPLYINALKQRGIEVEVIKGKHRNGNHPLRREGQPYPYSKKEGLVA